MSVTFYIEDTKYEKRIHDPGGDNEAIYYEPVPPYLELNLSNANARMFLKYFELDDSELCGAIAPEVAKTIGDRITRVLKEDNYSGLLRETVAYGNVVFCGTDKAYVISRLETFLKLFKLSVEQNKALCYA